MHNDLDALFSALRSRLTWASTGSRVSRGRRLGCLIAVLSAAPHAQAVESVDRLGRWMGFGWSDGYHACRDGGYHLGENLPPQSYAAQVQARGGHGSSCAQGNCAAVHSVSSYDGYTMATGMDSLPGPWQEADHAPALVPQPQSSVLTSPQPTQADKAPAPAPAKKPAAEGGSATSKAKKPVPSKPSNNNLLDKADDADLLEPDALLPQKAKPEKIPTPEPDKEPLSPSDSTRMRLNAPELRKASTQRVKPATFLYEPKPILDTPLRLPFTK